MRRKDREITKQDEIEQILSQCKVCRLAMIADGKPYIVPLNFGYEWLDDHLTLYFHSGQKGKKMDALRANPQVCVEMDWEGGVTGEGDTACTYSYAFRSIIGEGIVQFAESNDEKRHGFHCIMHHQTGRGGWTYSDAHLAVAAVFSVRADTLSASSKMPRKG